MNFLCRCEIYISMYVSKWVCWLSHVGAHLCTCIWIPRVSPQVSFLRSNPCYFFFFYGLSAGSWTLCLDWAVWGQAPATSQSPIDCWDCIRVPLCRTFQSCVCTRESNPHAFMACTYCLSHGLPLHTGVFMPCLLLPLAGNKVYLDLRVDGAVFLTALLA